MLNHTHQHHFRLLYYHHNNQMNPKVDQNEIMTWPQKHAQQLWQKGGVNHMEQVTTHSNSRICWTSLKKAREDGWKESLPINMKEIEEKL